MFWINKYWLESNNQLKSTTNIGLGSESLQIDQDVILDLSLSNLEIFTTAIHRLTSNTLIVWKHLPGGIYVSLSLQIFSFIWIFGIWIFLCYIIINIKENFCVNFFFSVLHNSTKCIAWFESTKNYLNWLDSNKGSYNCFESTNIDLNQTIN